MRSFYLAAGGTLFTFIMTALGAALVFCFRSRISERAGRLCFGFSGGVMSAAAVFSLLLPAAQQVEAAGGRPWLTAAAGFALGAASGVVEPIFGMLAALMISLVSGVMPGLMAFSAGAMMWVVFSEMLPESCVQRDGALAAAAGYLVMMALDLALG